MVGDLFGAGVAVVILKSAMAVILGLMSAGFILYFTGNGRLAAAMHTAAAEVILFAPLAVIAALTVIFAVKRQFLLGLAGILLLFLLTSEVFRG
jgi:hypothetical protein